MTRTQGNTAPDYLEVGFQELDQDLDLLIRCFEEVLRSLGLEKLADWLPWTHRDLPSGAPPEEIGLAYSIAFQLLNLVEEKVAARVRDLRESHEGLTAEHGLWGRQLARLREEGFGEEEIGRFITRTLVEPVLTAHPTEAKRLSVLQQHRVFSRLLDALRNQNVTPFQADDIRKRVEAALERLWRTGEILLEKPSLADERSNVLYYLREVFPDVLPKLDERLRYAWEQSGFQSPLPNAKLPRIRFGTWVGGDRDGHPGVTAQVTADTLAELRQSALNLVSDQILHLAGQLSLSGWTQPPPPELGVSSATQEPWREFVLGLHAKLQRGDFRFPHEFSAELYKLEDALRAAGAERLAESDVWPITRSLDIFGFHLAKLDIRQNSKFHETALAQLISAAGIRGDFSQWDEERRLEFLTAELRSPRPFLHASASAGPEADAVLACLRVLANHIEQYGPDGIGALIVSMTRTLSDLLVVYVLAREAGLTRALPTGLVCLLPVVPLFETIEDLQRGPDILRAFLAHPVTRQSVEFQRKRGARAVQQVMVGYSDSNKDGGILASQWNLHQAQLRLSGIGHDAGVDVAFFHGRGGTVSRGAGPTHRFLDALAPGSLCGTIRLTEQGETIAQKYANRATAAYNLELFLAGVSATSARHSRASHELHKLAPVVDRLASTSRTAYRKLLELEGFIPFHRQATPIDALEHSRIGSRPSRRTGQATLADLRAIPWVFSWNQARFYIPGWYGAGSALSELAENDPKDFEQLRVGQRDWPFLYYVLTNIEGSLASSDPEIMSAYADLVVDDEVRAKVLGLIMQEWNLLQEGIEKLRGGAIGTRRPRMLKTLGLRSDALKVLHRQQIDLLRRWREVNATEGPQAGDAMLPQLLLSINAIASGLRTTG